MEESLSIMLKTDKPFEAITEIAEQFLLFTLANMFILKRYNFFQMFIEKLGIQIDLDPSKINDLPASDNFKGNFWRLRAMYMIKNLTSHDESGQIDE